MINETAVQTFLNNHNYDIRKTHNGRWIDQKCTPDVVNFVADSTLQFSLDSNTSKSFTKNDIWRYKYSEEYIPAIFNKPVTSENQVENEYDKFFAQPLELFASARILNKSKRGRENIYTVANQDVLEYISINERNTINFLYMYFEKAINDSDIANLFEQFFRIQNQDSYLYLKDNFENFIRASTPINGVDEPRRIFTKVINILAFKKHKCGTKRGRISKSIITYPELMYNQENFRDLYADKPKGISRVDWERNHPRDTNPNWFKYESMRAKKAVRRYNLTFNTGLSEVHTENESAPATQIHHIFPEHAYHEIAMYHENLIAITPNQHMTKAHPNNDTRRIDFSYQRTLLLSKVHTIKKYVDTTVDGEFYSFDRFVEVLNIGLNVDYPISGNNYNTTIAIINESYR